MKTQVTQQVGMAIAQKRKLAGMTQQQVAEEIGVAVETVSRIETGDMSTTLKRLEQFADLFDCSVASFFHSSDSGSDELAMTLTDMIRTLKPRDKKILVDFIVKFVSYRNRAY
jgi:transcriptional regulator with XRE-family HTH domain